MTAVLLCLCLAVPAAAWAIDNGNGDLIWIGYDENGYLVTGSNDTYTSWNLYTGDLQVLRETGVYTQGASHLSERWCDQSGPLIPYFDAPLPGTCGFQLVTGNATQIESTLGTDGYGSPRANTNACHPHVVPPEPPGAPALVPGHCMGFWASWTPSPSADVASYRVWIGTSPGSREFFRSAQATSTFIDGLVEGATYYVSVAAIDAGGNSSLPSAETAATTTDTTTPHAPAGVAATPFTGGVRVAWPPVTENEESVPGDPTSPQIHDLSGYRVYRSKSASVPIDPAHRIAEVASGEGVTAAGDTGVVACRYYAYAVTAVDTCGVESAPSPPVVGIAPTELAPLPPAQVRAFKGASTNTISWNATTRDAAWNPIVIDTYRVERTPPTLRTTPQDQMQFAALKDVAGGATSLVDLDPPPVLELEALFYRVHAVDDCPNVSDASNVAEASCSFSGDVQIVAPGDDTGVAGVVPVVVQVWGGTDTYTGVTITYTHVTQGQTRTYAAASAGLSWGDFGWLASPAGAYAIQATVTNSTGCAKTATVHVKAGSEIGCCLSVYPTTTTTASCGSGGIKCKEVSYRIGNNQCLAPVALSSMNVQWTDYSGRTPHWVTAKFNGTAIAAAGSWTTTYDGQTPQHGSAQKTNFSAPSPIVPYANPMTSGNTTFVTYAFDNFTDSGSGATRKVNVFNVNMFTFTFLDANGTPSDVTTTCSMPPLTVN